jgi:hypothetical protein
MSRLEKGLPWIFFLGFAALLLLDSGLWHPGFSYFDEGPNVIYVQQGLEGGRFSFELFKGCIHRNLVILVMQIFGPSLGAWRAFTLLALGLETLLIGLVARRLNNSKAGVWAACFNLCCAVTFLRARSLLSYSLLPLELLSLIWLLPHMRKSYLAFAWGAVAAFMLSDYEGWIFCLPVLALLAQQEPGQTRPRLAYTAFGFFAALLFLLVLSWKSLPTHFLVRTRTLPTGVFGAIHYLWLSLRSFFWGGETFAYMGISQHSVYPWWALPALVFGVLASPRKLLAWLLLGLIPMVFIGTAAEPNRLMVAWPVLCLLTGLGFSRVSGRLELLIFPLLIFGAGLEAKAYVNSVEKEYQRFYGPSAEMMRLAAKMKAQYPLGVALINELDYESSAGDRFIWTSYGPPKAQEPVFALIPWEYAINLDPSWGTVVWSGPGFLFLKASKKAALRLGLIQDEIFSMRKPLPRFDLIGRRQGLLDYLATHPKSDMWVRTSAMEGAFGMSTMIGDFPKDLMMDILKEKLASASVYAWLADKAKLTDPAFAQYLATRALRKDPRREDLKKFLE